MSWEWEAKWQRASVKEGMGARMGRDRTMADFFALPSFLFRSGDFSFYDHVLDTVNALNIIPERYLQNGLSPLDVSFGTLISPFPLSALARWHSFPALDPLR